MDITFESLANHSSINDELTVNCPLNRHNMRIRCHLAELVNKLSICEPYEIEIKGKIRVEIDTDDQICTQFLPESGRLDLQMIVEAFYHMHGTNLDSIANIDFKSKI